MAEPPAGPAGPPPLLLAMDTATATGGVALLRGPTVLGEETWQAGGRQTAQILPAAARLWERAGATAGDLRAVAVALGPGSFTGLRVGLSLGKGFALALGVPLLGVPTLDAVAHQHQDAGGTLGAVLVAGRGQYYLGVFRRRAGRLARRGAYVAGTAAEVADRLAAERRPFVCGEVGPELLAALAGRLGATFRVPTPAATLRRPAFLGELAQRRLATGDVPDAATLQPIYLRRTT